MPLIFPLSQPASSEPIAQREEGRWAYLILYEKCISSYDEDIWSYYGDIWSYGEDISSYDEHIWSYYEDIWSYDEDICQPSGKEITFKCDMLFLLIMELIYSGYVSVSTTEYHTWSMSDVITPKYMRSVLLFFMEWFFLYFQAIGNGFSGH